MPGLQRRQCQRPAQALGGAAAPGLPLGQLCAASHPAASQAAASSPPSEAKPPPKLVLMPGVAPVWGRRSEARSHAQLAGSGAEPGLPHSPHIFCPGSSLLLLAARKGGKVSESLPLATQVRSWPFWRRHANSTKRPFSEVDVVAGCILAYSQ